jgi:D-alanine--poly(phosphoribitol) ligase subunit 1
VLDLHQTLRDVFLNNPHQAAVEGARGKTLTYGELLTIAWRIRSQFEDVKGGPVSSVGILSTRRMESYIAVLSCYFWGIKFVPMNPKLPVSRLQRITESGVVDLILCDSSTCEKAEQIDRPRIEVGNDVPESIETAEVIPPHSLVPPEAIAYQMFTSGSTGDPKGVPIAHSSLSHYVLETKKLMRIPDGLRFSQTFDLSFDLSMHDIFLGLSCAGTIIPANDINLMIPNAYIQKREIDVWFSVPMLALLAHNGQNDKPVTHHMRIAMFCGEQLPSDYALKFTAFMDETAPIYNLYGPTEATIAFTYKLFSPGEADIPVVPLGEGFGENKIAIEQSDGVIVLPESEVEGELLLGGPQVFAGYDPSTSADVFVNHENQTYYRSGDLVRFSDGQLHHLGRKDSQIKFRGYRIELGDIEASFRKVFDCSAAVAILLGEGQGRRIVVAYESATEMTDFSSLRSVLPDYMVPEQFMRVEKMPTNINGKIDRKALAQLSWDQ